MPVILAFGDSNTWGYDPGTGNRFPPDVRWTGVMQGELGASFKVIEEGLNGRTTVLDDPLEPYRSGLAYLPPCLMSHAPLDLVVLSLGCNDLKKQFSRSSAEIAAGVEQLVVMSRSYSVGPNGRLPEVILIAPPRLAKLTAFAEMFTGAQGKSRDLSAQFRAVAAAHGTGFIDAGDHIQCSPLDGIHYEAAEHAKLGRVVAAAVKDRLR